MCKSNDPTYKPDWAAWAVDDRQAKQMAAALTNPEIAREIGKALALDAPSATGMIDPADGKTPDMFDTVIAGPWMGRWDVVHHNRHGRCSDPKR
jgi:hypothetical protein